MNCVNVRHTNSAKARAKKETRTQKCDDDISYSVCYHSPIRCEQWNLCMSLKRSMLNTKRKKKILHKSKIMTLYFPFFSVPLVWLGCAFAYVNMCAILKGSTHSMLSILWLFWKDGSFHCFSNFTDLFAGFAESIRRSVANRILRNNNFSCQFSHKAYE